ncbi:MAG: hypothetical protein PHS96_05910 [Anaerolineales bacterium]|nr:hypothetical protein [Anaerolineales bacterium]
MLRPISTPLLVHFPIAPLLMTSVTLDRAGLRWPRRGLERAAWVTHLGDSPPSISDNFC